MELAFNFFRVILVSAPLCMSSEVVSGGARKRQQAAYTCVCVCVNSAGYALLHSETK